MQRGGVPEERHSARARRSMARTPTDSLKECRSAGVRSSLLLKPLLAGDVERLAAVLERQKSTAVVQPRILQRAVSYRAPHATGAWVDELELASLHTAS